MKIKQLRKRKNPRRQNFIKRIWSRIRYRKYKHSSKNTKKRKVRVFWGKLGRYLLVFVLVALFGGLLYVSIRSVFRLKGDDNSDSEFFISEGEVVGISGVPQFPGSRFIYEDEIDSDIVQDFLSDGKSAYDIPDNSSWDDVIDFYDEEMKKLGWEHNLSVSVGDETKMPGEYWIRYDEQEEGAEDESVTGIGLRIYTKVNDIWYERLSLNDAVTGLAEMAQRLSEIELMVSVNTGGELPDDFPWELTYPQTWAVKEEESTLLSLKMVEFLNSESEGAVAIVPYDFASLESLDSVADRFIRDLNNYRDPQDRFEILGNESVTIADQEGVRYVIESPNNKGGVALVTHPQSGVIYAIYTYTGETAFWDFVINNIELKTD